MFTANLRIWLMLLIGLLIYPDGGWIVLLIFCIDWIIACVAGFIAQCRMNGIPVEIVTAFGSLTIY
jgi:hypothetical protein